MKAGRKVAKQKYLCVGGPLKDQFLYLASPGTLYMNFGGVVGRYARVGQITVVWQPK